MSNLPAIDYAKVSQLQAERLKETEYQLIQIQVLAETLLAERDEALAKLQSIEEER